MTNEEVKQLIETHIEGSQAIVEGDGYHYQAKVVSQRFEGVRPVKRQQMVYAAVQDQIADGSLHALTITAQTPSEAT